MGEIFSSVFPFKVFSTMVLFHQKNVMKLSFDEMLKFWFPGNSN